MEEYRHVDFASALQRNPPFRNNVVRIERVEELVKRYRWYECYITYFLYTEDILEYMRNNIRSGRQSICGYKGKLYANYLPIDIDSKDLKQAKEAAIETLGVLRNLGIKEKGIKLYFSGNAGFHLMADGRNFGGFTPSRRLNLYFAEFRDELAKMIDNGKTIDRKIKDTVRLWRMPNTMNKKSGLYKIQITEAELNDLSIGEIKKIAKNQRHLWDTDITGLIPLYDLSNSRKAAAFYNGLVGKVNERAVRFSYPKIRFQGMCPAKENIYRSHIQEGDRNNCALILASHFRQEGKSMDRARSLLYGWNETNSIGLNEMELENVVKSAYRNGHAYKFGCSSLVSYCPYNDKKECEYIRKIISRG